MKICKLCGRQFEPRSNAQTICNNTHYRNCEVCGRPFVITRPSDSQACCSKECTQRKREITMNERYGVKHALQSLEFREKAENTSIQRYGVKHAAQSDEIKDATKRHFKTTYGVDTPFQMNDFWDKAKQTNLAKYGTEYAIQNEDVRKKSEQTCLNKYGTLHSIQSDAVKSRVEQACLSRYGVPYPCMTDQCRESSSAVISKLNRSVADKISKATGLPCELDTVKIDRFSYDIHIKDTNILLEIDPTYTHNAIGNHWDKRGLDRNYHLTKTKLAESKGYRCIHVFDWDDLSKVIRLLAPKTVIYGRKCTVQVLTRSVCDSFEVSNHLQGNCKGQQVCLGLYYSDELVQVMTFGKPRYNRNYQWELLRLCSSYEIRVVGGAERLFKHFISMYNPNSIISYCDRAKFSGDVYSKLGFQLDHSTEPNKIWSKGTSKITNNLLLLRGYDQLFQTAYGKGTSNESLMLEHGWLPVYDCGQNVYSWRYNK